ncbi:MAG: hypothetical protein IT453_11005 [Planctomycetes bacterium]|nr:hypothetical protein [Planctomycetota bacterium]
MRAIIARNGPESLLFTVLTFDPSAYDGDASTAWLELSPAFKRLCKRLRRRFGSVQHISTVEQHASGWPHLNVLFFSHGMRARWETSATGLRDDLRHHAVQAGFGYIVESIEPPRELDGIAGYMVKTADRSTRGGIANEVAKLSQLPVNAPFRFRRLRISRGLSRPERAPKKSTGHLLRMPLERAEAKWQDWRSRQRRRARRHAGGVTEGHDARQAPVHEPFASSAQVEQLATDPGLPKGSLGSAARGPDAPPAKGPRAVDPSSSGAEQRVGPSAGAGAEPRSCQKKG